MVTLLPTVTHRSDLYGWAEWIHWETSGAHFYGWDAPRLFFSADIYTCKPFCVDLAVAYTRDFFDATRVAYREFSSVLPVQAPHSRRLIQASSAG